MRYLLHSAYLTAISKNLLSISFRSASESSLICRSISSSLTVIICAFPIVNQRCYSLHIFRYLCKEVIFRTNIVPDIL